jgi:hypothetical protein
MCVDGACMAKEAEFTTVMFEMTPPVSAPEIAGVRFLETLDSLPVSGGAVDLMFGHVAFVTGHVIPQRAGYQTTCQYAFENGATLTYPNPDVTDIPNSIPVRVTLVPSQGVLGLPTVDYSLDLFSSRAGGDYGFSLHIPPGSYSVYIEPAAPTDTACAIPPQLYRNLDVAPGNVDLQTIELPAPQHLALTVRWSGSGTLDGWMIDMVDPVTGRLISTEATLSDSAYDATLAQYTTAIDYSPVVDTIPSAGKELVRLSPPDGVAAPTLLMERGALELFAKGEGIIDQLTMLPQPVTVKGQVERAGSTTPVKASITFVATETYDVSTGVRASYVRTVDSADDGTFSVELLPGQYAVYALPGTESGLAATTTTLLVSRPAPGQLVQAGKSIELTASAVIGGSVFDPGGRGPISGAQVQAVPTPVAQPLALYDRTLGPVSFVPRVSTTSLDGNGGFSVLADPGIFDVSVRPERDTRFAWLVRPNVSVAQPRKDLGHMQLPLPVRYHGAVTTPAAGRVPGALIRAYIYMDETPAYTGDPTLARSVLQIGETTSDDQGDFDLYLPSQIN